ncbi:hypothetical protein ACFYXJ_02790 [Streptomyces sp. NPDC002667]|uniref:DUF7144 family membrane protein n=1 Tax=Streptomyces sp. NPDC002667 TaxID=3364657 RepID=UPI0036CEA8BD
MATTQHHSTHSKTALTAAGGLTIFASVMLFVAGVLDILRGVMAIAQDDVFVTTQNYVFKFDLTSWGWIHLALGALAVIVSLGLFAAATWARVIGVGIAALLIIANFLDIPYYPVWSLTLIALYGFVIWALCVARPDRDMG